MVFKNTRIEVENVVERGGGWTADNAWLLSLGFEDAQMFYRSDMFRFEPYVA